MHEHIYVDIDRQPGRSILISFFISPYSYFRLRMGNTPTPIDPFTVPSFLNSPSTEINNTPLLFIFIFFIQYPTFSYSIVSFRKKKKKMNGLSAKYRPKHLVHPENLNVFRQCFTRVTFPCQTESHVIRLQSSFFNSALTRFGSNLHSGYLQLSLPFFPFFLSFL